MASKRKKGALGILTKIGNLWLKKNILRSLLISIIAIAVQIIIIIIFFSQLPPKVPLYYSRPWGQQQLADTIYLFLLPGLSLAVFILNSLIAALFVDHEDFYSYCLSWVTTIFSVFCLITLLKIVYITI